MNKERLAAFTDAVLAIIMTILVLELEKPKTVNLAVLWDLRANFFAYTLSFFWLGLMWTTHHNNWHSITKVSNATVSYSLLMLFIASLFPYTTSLVATNFNNVTAQTFYGLVVLGVSFSNMAISHSLKQVNPSVHFGWLYALPNTSIILDVVIKLIGLLITLTVYPPAMMYAIFIDIFVVGYASRQAIKKQPKKS
ncbi:TMEM175 family protein [Pediococcus inopinatus]|uniref:TMEM175 family protein n=1 Tax=Pediococcus inopinatus TaxID=114090 RepID=UPI00070AA434|nr:TMEM175 family protein [Pediococcus inopinatus]AVL00058.1 DUF1211 domain-containing membrane protein [Pediococcus inopinatus]KRN61022.1 hypothetical protein IV83_GL001182 [Pediococcus inopinatus]